MFQRILVPTDGSELAARAMPLALALGKPAHASLHLLRSTVGMWLPAPAVAPVYGGVYGPYDWLPGPEEMQLLREEARATLHALAAAYDEPSIDWHMTVVDDDPAGAIVDYAREQAIDLIIMSSHGYSELERWALGSVAERVLHDAPCPVFVVRDEALPQRLLITLDGSPLAETVLPPALEVARLLRLPVCLLRVERAPHPGESTSHALHIERAQTYLDDRCLHLQDDGPHVETVVLQGRPAPAILDYAAHNNFDAIALATHGFSGLRRWIYGSVTAKILRAAQCSLLVVRPHWESDTVEEYSPFIP